MSTDLTTKDLNEAAFIWSQPYAVMTGHEIVADSGNPTVYFKFTVGISPQELHQLILEYSNGNTTVEPLRYCQKQVQLRTLIHDLTRKHKYPR